MVMLAVLVVLTFVAVFYSFGKVQVLCVGNNRHFSVITECSCVVEAEKKF